MTINSGGYNTGVSTQALDFGSISKAYMQSAVEQKLLEIKEDKTRIDSNAERVLKAMSVSVIPELTGALRDQYSKKIEDYRTQIIDRFKKTEGKLGYGDQAFIEKGAVDLGNEMNVKKSQIAQRAKLTDYITDQRFAETIDQAKLAEEAAQWDEGFQKGTAVKPIEQMIIESYKQKPTVEYILDIYDKAYKTMGESGSATINGHVYTETLTKDPATLQQFVNDIYTGDSSIKRRFTKDGVVDQRALEADKQNTYNILLSRQIKNSPAPRYTSGSGGGSGSLAKKQELYPTQLGDQTWYNLPSTMGQTVKTYSVGQAIDPKTGKVIDVNADVPLKVVGFSNDGMIKVEANGGVLKSGDKPLLYQKESLSGLEGKSLSEKQKKGLTEADIKNRAFSMLTAAVADQPSPADETAEWTNATDVKVVEDGEGGYKLVGTLNAYEGKWGSNVKPDEAMLSRYKKVDSKTVEIPFYTVTDEKEKQILHLPVADYRNLLSGQEKSYKIGNQTVADYLDNLQTQPKQESGKKDFSVAAFNKAKNKNYTKEQIQAAYGKDYNIVP